MKQAQFHSSSLCVVVIQSVDLTMTIFAKLKFNSCPSLVVVVSLDTMLYDSYLCSVESNKQQVEEVGKKTQPENSETKQLLI